MRHCLICERYWDTQAQANACAANDEKGIHTRAGAATEARRAAIAECVAALVNLRKSATSGQAGLALEDAIETLKRMT